MSELQYFATFSPANTLAKMAFSDLAGVGNEDSQPRRFMQMNAEKVFDKTVLQFRRERHGDGGETDTGSPTDMNTDTEQKLQEEGMIWTGSYVLSLKSLPRNTDGFGWIVGRLGGPQVDLALATRKFARDHNITLRGNHSRLNFSQDRAALFIAKADRHASTEVSVGGAAVTGIHYLNQRSMKIRISSLEYEFSYTAFANQPEYYRDLNDYLQRVLKFSIDPARVQIPTPQGLSRTFGDWTIGVALGKGAEGNVYLASDHQGDVVAIKVIVRTRVNAPTISKDIRNLKTLTKLSKEHDERRLVRLREAIYPRDTDEYDPSSAFDEVALILEPYTKSTLDSYLAANKKKSEDAKQGMTLQAATIFRQLSLAIQFLHTHGWIHGDVKPENVGISIAQSTYNVVLLDIGTSIFVGSPAVARNPTPGRGGTIRYLAPERELIPYTPAVDVWSLGVIGFELMYGYHPWPFAKNPWRKGQEYETMRPRFNISYEKTMVSLEEEPRATNTSAQRFQVSPLLRQMLAHSWAESNQKSRIGISEAVQHPSWGMLLDDGDKDKGERESKRLRNA